jgi:hypothetical protein
MKTRRPSTGGLGPAQVSDASAVDWSAPVGGPSSTRTTSRVDAFTNPALEKRLAEIPQLDMAALRATWADIYGRPPPKFMSRRLLELAAAYDAQAKVYGGLKPTTRRKLLQIASTRTGSPAGATRRKPRATLAPGSRLVREWQGRPHTVEVLEGGFLYAGRRYRSLSEIARAITGARWSGPRFFGL